MKIVLLLLSLVGCVSTDEISRCHDVCGFRGVKLATWNSCQCHPQPRPCQ